jgi:hypothetical protein
MREPPQKGESSFAGGRSPLADTGLCNLGSRSNTPESILQALDIETRYKTSFWDALILQAAESAGASILYSEDLAAAQHYGSIQIVNPLIGKQSHR